MAEPQDLPEGTVRVAQWLRARAHRHAALQAMTGAPVADVAQGQAQP